MKLEEVFALDNAGWPALLVNEACTILKANQTAVKLFGSPLEGAAPLLSSIWATENGPTAEQFIGQWERSPAATVSLKFRIKGGGMGSFSVAICAVHKDEQKCFILQLMPDWSFAGDAKSHATNLTSAQRHKLDVALQLSRSVALDFNNALTSILGYTSLILSQMEANNAWRPYLLEVEKSASRAAEIADDLATFSRQETKSREQSAGNLNSILQRSVDLFRSNSAKSITWAIHCEPRLFAVKFDEAKLQQALVKIIENAMDALGAGGRITVQTRNVELTQSTQDRELRLAAGTYVCVEISDTGKGIPADVLPRIFEPFFTTKKASGHRGLGLALVYGIITNHAGGVAVSSQPEVGTSVRVYLPAENTIVQDTTIDARELKGTQTVLMVDDEDSLLAMGKTILTSYGYRVVTANSGQKALDIFTRGEPKVDLVVTDLVMPGMSGRELAERIRHVSPQMPILSTSGIMRSTHESEACYLQKPFTSQELLVKVKAVLAGNIS